MLVRSSFSVISVTCVLLLAPALTCRADAQRPGRPETITPPATVFSPLLQRGGQEPAYARGYAAGYQRGVADARRGDRYDPANSREYRDADQGYSDSYGSREAYRNNYRAGFRKGYDDGYRNQTR